jgi:hypothetical protein
MILIFGRSRLKAELAALEHMQKAEHFLIRHGVTEGGFSAESYVRRAGRIGHLRQVLGYIPKPGAFTRIDYEAGLKRDTTI